MVENTVDTKVVAIVDGLAKPSTIVLSSGAEIKPLEIPDMLIQMLYSSFPSPKPPIVEIKSGGRTWVQDNPDDPRFAEAKTTRDQELSAAMINLVLLRGMEVITLPSSIPPVDDLTWPDELALMGLAVPEFGAGRALVWLKRFVVPRSSDLAAVQSAALALSGATEEAITEAQDRFQR